MDKSNMKSLHADFPRYDVLKSNQISASNPGSQQPVSPPGDDTPIAPRDCTAIPWG